jgi:hypothetical protein
MRILVVYEDSHRAYGETMERTVRALRPGLEVALAHLRDIEEALKDFEPHAVVCGHPNTFDPGSRAAWIVLAEEPDEPSEVCLGGRRTGLQNPGLEELLEILDRAEEMVRMGDAPGGC